jgi:hypothetical protein
MSRSLKTEDTKLVYDTALLFFFQEHGRERMTFYGELKKTGMLSLRP